MKNFKVLMLAATAAAGISGVAFASPVGGATSGQLTVSAVVGAGCAVYLGANSSKPGASNTEISFGQVASLTPPGPQYGALQVVCSGQTIPLSVSLDNGSRQSTSGIYAGGRVIVRDGASIADAANVWPVEIYQGKGQSEVWGSEVNGKAYKIPKYTADPNTSPIYDFTVAMLPKPDGMPVSGRYSNTFMATIVYGS